MGKTAEMSAKQLKKAAQTVIDHARKGGNFGFCLGDPDPAIVTHKSKKASQLGKLAKAEAGGTKFAFGKMSFAGGKIYFQCEVDPPSKARKALKDYLAKCGVSVKPVIVAPDGKIDDEDLEGAAGPQQVQAEFLKEVNAVVRELMPRFAKQPELKSRVDRLIQEIQPLMAETPFPEAAAARALEGLRALRTWEDAAPDPAPRDDAAPRMGGHRGAAPEPEREDTGAAPDPEREDTGAAPDPEREDTGAAPDPEAEKLRTLFSRIHARLMQALGADPKRKAAIDELARRFEAALGAEPPDLAGAKAIADRAQRALPKPSHAPAPEPERAAPEPEPEPDERAAPLVRAKKSWTGGLARSAKEIQTLRSEINKACDGLPGAAKIDKAFARIGWRLQSFRNALDGVLDPGISDPKKAEAARRDAARTAGEILAMLEKDKVLAELDTNPFVSITAVTTLNRTLSDIRRQLG